MKKHLFVALAMLLSILGATAQTFTSGDFEFRICTDNDGNPTTDVAVTRCLLEENADVVIPETVSYNDTEYTVKYIDLLPFTWTYINSLHIPAGIINININENEIAGTLSILNEITCDSENNYYTIYDGALYTKDLSTLCICPCNKESLITPDATRTISSYALRGSNIKSVVLNDGLEKISSHAFSACRNLTTINLPEGLQVISHWAFSQCYKLTSINIPESLRRIEDWAFHECTSLSQTIYIPASLVLEGYPFLNCPVSYTVSLDNKDYADYDGSLYSKDYQTLIKLAGNQTELRFPTPTRSIASHAFSYCELENIHIPEQISDIDDMAFANCSATIISLPNTISEIKYATFIDCANLKHITIPPSVSTIGDYAFSHCSSLESVVIPESVMTLSSCAFSYIIQNNFNVIVLGDNTDISTSASEPVYHYPSFYTKGSTYNKLLVALENYQDKVKRLPSELVGDWGWSIGPNSRYAVYYTFKKYEPANGLQFDITMPEGLSVEKFLAKGQGIQSSWSELPDGRYRVIAYTEDGAFLPTDACFDIELSSDERLKRSEILFHNIIFSIAGIEYSIPDEKHYVSGYDIIFPDLNEIEEGDSFELPTPLRGNFEDVTYSWGSSDKTIAKIDENNMLHALRPGETEIYVSVKDPHGIVPSSHKRLTVTPALWGDADGNGTIDIADVVATVNYILERNPEQFNAKLADVDRNGRINIVDLTAIVKLVIAQPAPDADGNSPAGAPALSELAFSEPTIDADGRRHISLEIEPSADYTALQTDIELPEGVAVEAVALADGFSRHSLDYAAVSPTSTRVVIYSPALVEVAAGERTGVIDITLSASDEARGTIRATRTVACDTEGHSYTLAAAEAELNNTTGLSSAAGAQASARALPGGVEVTAPEGMAVRISDVAGRVIADYSAGGAPRFHALAPGVYAVSFEGAATAKVLVK